MKVYRKTFSQYQAGYIPPLHLFTQPAAIHYSPAFKLDGSDVLKDILNKSAKQLSTQMVLAQASKRNTARLLNHILMEFKQANIERTICVVDSIALIKTYIGETEKNLIKLLAEAETQQWILFFDQADALFTPPAKSQKSRDQYANLEVSYIMRILSRQNVLSILEINQASTLEIFKRLHVPVIH